MEIICKGVGKTPKLKCSNCLQEIDGTILNEDYHTKDSKIYCSYCYIDVLYKERYPINK